MSDEHPEVLVPHSARDMRRVGVVIGSAGIALGVIAWRFVALGADPADLHAGYTFAVGGVLLLGVGIAISIKAWRRD